MVACYGILKSARDAHSEEEKEASRQPGAWAAQVRSSIVTERCRTSLEQFLGDHREWAHLTADEVDMRKYTILLHVSLGLEKLHDMGVLHRDIKSGNILLDGVPKTCCECQHAGKWKICDFGQARVLKDPRVCFAEPCHWPAGWAAIPQLADRFQPVTSPVRSPETKKLGQG